MNTIKILRIVPVLFLSGCAEYYGYQPPAPVYGHPSTNNPYENPYPAGRDEQPSPPYHEHQNEQSETAPDSTVYQPKPVYQRPLSPAVIALVNESERNSRAGDLESAVVVLERALRIEPRNAELTLKLARLRLQQEKPVLAEDLARKAALLAGGNNQLKRKSWLLISQARRMQHNLQGAKEAQRKANSFR